MAPPPPPTKIGVFDSGFGGLTVLRALLSLMPYADYTYLGDTARLPYGSKSHETIARYAISSARFLQERGAELLVIACNTATALALEDIRQAVPIPVIGVIEPGAQAALHASKKIEPLQNQVPHLRDGLIVAKVGELPQHSTQATKNNTVTLSEAKNPRISPKPPQISDPGHVLVLATAATVQSRAYTRALHALGLEATEKACPLLVPLVEEGWINHPVTDETLKIYLTEALTAAPSTETLLLGCTHYPLLEPAIHRTLAALGHPLTVIDSAEATAQAVAAHLALNSPRQTQSAPDCLFYATDSIEKFQRLGSSFLGQPLAKVDLIDLGG